MDEIRTCACQTGDSGVGKPSSLTGLAVAGLEVLECMAEASCDNGIQMGTIANRYRLAKVERVEERASVLCNIEVFTEINFLDSLD